MHNPNKTTRNGALDALKIIAIMMVIASHYLNTQFGNGLINTRSILGISTHLLLSIFIVACNIFVLVTGYYCAKKDSVSLKKGLRLIIVTLFYGIIIAITYILIKRPQFNFTLLKTLLSSIIDRWFIVLYIILYFLIPYINKTINNISKKSYQRLLIILLFFFSIWPTLLTDVTLKDNGYGMVNFVCIYLIGAYIRLYENDVKKHKNKFYIFGTISLAITTILSFVSYRAWNYCSIFVILQSVALFLYFKKLKIRSSHMLTRIASFSLGIYIIHENHLICKWIYQDLFNCKTYIGTWLYLPNIVFTVLGIFIICSIIDYGREILFKHTVDKILLHSTIINRSDSLSC